MKTFSFDFDGVIHKYSKGWHDGTAYDVEVTGTVELMNKLLKDGYSVFILSSREPAQIQNWFAKYYPDVETEIIGDQVKFWNKRGVVGITQRKLPAHVYVDDRAFKFEGVNEYLYGEITTFKTWQE